MIYNCILSIISVVAVVVVSTVRFNFVQTYRERNSFIMTQAPLENTIEDFWRMIWDYSIGTIVMLNELEEKGQVLNFNDNLLLIYIFHCCSPFTLLRVWLL